MNIKEYNSIEELIKNLSPNQLAWYNDSEFPGLIYKTSKNKLFSLSFTEFQQSDYNHITLKEVIKDL